MRYAVITPARNEESNLPRCAEWIVSQTHRPSEWIIVDNGSTDRTMEVVEALQADYPWIRLITAEGAVAPTRGGPIVRAFGVGLESMRETVDVVVKLDADLSGDRDYFERLLRFFAEDPRLGIAGGICQELKGDRWVATHATIGHVRGASRAYRWSCLEELLPLEARMGWDGLDALKATTRGWRTATVPVPFRHHRRVGERDGSERKRWLSAGEQAHYMNYRPSYVVARSLRWAATDWRASAMMVGYLHAIAMRRSRYGDPDVRTLVRDRQRLRYLGLRAAEALGLRH